MKKSINSSGLLFHRWGSTTAFTSSKLMGGFRRVNKRKPKKRFWVLARSDGKIFQLFRVDVSSHRSPLLQLV